MNPLPSDERVRMALDEIWQHAGIDGEHHKRWLIDRLVRILADDYDAWVQAYGEGDDGPATYEWDCGIAP